MLLQLAYRFASEVSPRLAMKAGYLWAYKGSRARARPIGGASAAASFFRPFCSSP